MRRALALLALGTGLGGCARTPARLPAMPATGTYAWGEVRDLLPETVGMIALIPIPDSLLARVEGAFVEEFAARGWRHVSPESAQFAVHVATGRALRHETATVPVVAGLSPAVAMSRARPTTAEVSVEMERSVLKVEVIDRREPRRAWSHEVIVTPGLQSWEGLHSAVRALLRRFPEPST